MIDDFNSYMKLSKEERQEHLDLNTPCCERGGNSTNHRGVLAQYLDTIIPMGRKAILAHACNNENCSNPQHLYWSTDRENIVEDGSKFGTHKDPWARMVEKYGYEKACQINAKRRQGNLNGAGNKGKPKSEEHKKALSLANKSRHEAKNVV